MKMKIGFLGVLLLSLANFCCGQENVEDFDFGHVQNDKYVNSFFHFEMTLPLDWIVQTKDQMDYLAETGKELVAGDDAVMKAALKGSEVNTANLMAVYQYETGSPVEYNPSIMLVAENIARAPGIKTGGDYLFQSRRLLAQSQFKYDHLDEEFEKEIVNGTEFYKMNAEVKYLGLDIKQIYYSTVLKRFSFNVIVSFINDEQRTNLLNSISSMSFGD
jgi:hypothetical protein